MVRGLHGVEGAVTEMLWQDQTNMVKMVKKEGKTSYMKYKGTSMRGRGMINNKFCIK